MSFGIGETLALDGLFREGVRVDIDEPRKIKKKKISCVYVEETFDSGELPAMVAEQESAMRGARRIDAKIEQSGGMQVDVYQ